MPLHSNLNYFYSDPTFSVTVAVPRLMAVDVFRSASTYSLKFYTWVAGPAYYWGSLHFVRFYENQCIVHPNRVQDSQLIAC